MDKELTTEQQVPSGVLRAITFGILSEEDAKGTAAKVIGVVNEVTDPALGLPNPTNECFTCGAKDGKACEGHFGIIDFPVTVINPYFISEVAKILNKICPGCKSVRRDKVKSANWSSSPRQPRNCKYCDGSSRDRYPTMKFFVSSKDVFGKTAIIAELNKKLTARSRKKSSGENLASDYWDIIPHDAQLDGMNFQVDGMNLKSNTRRVLSPAQAYSILKDVDPRFLEATFKRKSSIFLNCLLVTPNCHRVTEFGQHMVFDESTKLYRKLIDFRGTANELNNRVLDRIKCSKIHADKSETKFSDHGPSYGSKYIKELLLAKRNDHIFRMVVVGDPNIKLSELGVPCHIAERLKISDHINPWNWNQLRTYCELMILGKGEISVRRGGGLVCLRSIDDLQRGDIVYRPLIDGDIVLISRPPSIHQHSLIALSVKILPLTSVLSVNPLICSPLRGDFDGDCLHGYVPQSVDSKVELRELVALDKQLIDGQSGRNLLSLSQDSLTAAYLILEDGVFLNQFHMQQLQMFCPRQLELPAFIKAITSTTCFWTGKQLFSLLFPSDFNYDFPPNGVHIREGQLISSSNGSSWLRDADGNLCHTLAQKFKGEALDFLYAAQEVLCEWLSTRGLSVSLSDLYLSSDEYIRQNLLEEVSYGLQEAQMQSHIGLVMVEGNEDFLAGNSEESQNAVNCGVEHMSIEKQKSAVLSQVSVAAFKQVFWDIQNILYPYAGKDNSLLVMLKAGSKGNLLKLVQQSMCLGLQHSLVPLSFRLPHRLSCAAWNNQKPYISNHKCHDVPEHSKSYIPCAVVENSFLTGLNPLECFVHSLTTRDSSFSGHADVAGTLSRRLMYFMRDLCVAYDGTVRNAYGNRLVQFSYASNENGISGTCDSKALNEGVYGCDVTGGHPVGALAACAISEAAYSALDQPFSALESSPLLNFKKVLECGGKKGSGPKTASLYLSKKLGRRIYGFEYGALEVKSHLERLLFSDIVSSVMIFFLPETSSRTHTSQWVSHFHIYKEVAKKRGLKLQSMIDALRSKYDSSRVKLKAHLPIVKIMSKGCSEVDMQDETNAKFCITVSIAESSQNSSRQLDLLRDTVIPFLLGTVVKGFEEFKKVDILWKDEPRSSKGSSGEMYLCSSGELYMRVFMSENCDRMKFWRALMNRCLGIWDMIDWERSHPDDIQDIATAYGIDVAWKHFLSNLKSAVADAGKNILPEHLVLIADCLASTGEFVPLSTKGLALQRKETSRSSPFIQACLSNPGDGLIKAAKMGVTDNLEGSVEALSWGNTPSIGTGGHFDILYAGKGYEPAKPIDVYGLLGCHAGSVKETVKVKLPEEQNEISVKETAQSLLSKTLISKNLGSFFSANDILKLYRRLKYILHKYDVDCRLSELDKSIVMMALHFHPRRREKIGSGANEIKVGYHSQYEDSRCFLLVRTDGTVEDFSYHKCVLRALELIAPQKARLYHSKWLNGRN